MTIKKEKQNCSLVKNLLYITSYLSSCIFFSAISAWSCCCWASLCFAIDLSKFRAPIAQKNSIAKEGHGFIKTMFSINSHMGAIHCPVGKRRVSPRAAGSQKEDELHDPKVPDKNWTLALRQVQEYTQSLAHRCSVAHLVCQFSLVSFVKTSIYTLPFFIYTVRIKPSAQ